MRSKRRTWIAVGLCAAAIVIIVGLAIVTGLDKRIETLLVDISPEWLTDLTTRY